MQALNAARGVHPHCPSSTAAAAPLVPICLLSVMARHTHLSLHAQGGDRHGLGQVSATAGFALNPLMCL